MKTDNRKITLFFKKTTFWIVVIAFIIFALLLFFGIATGNGAAKLRTDAYVSLLSDLMVAAFIYIAAYLFLTFPKEMSRSSEFQEEVVQPISLILQSTHHNMMSALRDNNRTVHPKIAEIDWANLFEGADEILLLVQGWDGWKDKVADYLPAFLGRGGKISVILHDPSKNELLKRMAERMGRTEVQEKEEIEKTLRGLREATKQYPNQLTARYTKCMNWFCGIYFKSSNCNHGKLLLSIYQHQPTGGLARSKVPSFLIRTDVFPELGEWFDAEWKHLTLPENSFTTSGAI